MTKRTFLIGLISDTHAPDRCKELPGAIFEALAGVDLILHAGDVGKLWVLDQLSQIAPVIAVHGNDETDDAKAALPYLQTISIAGHRIVLTHSHYLVLTEEMESRKEDRWEPKLARLAEFGKQHGASIVVYGHSHIPMEFEWEGDLLINPGAIASGSNITHQKVQTVAKLYLEPDAKPRLEHFDLSNPAKTYVPPFDYTKGFMATVAPYSESILAPELEPTIEWFRQTIYPLAPKPVVSAVNRVAHRVWAGKQSAITPSDVVVELRSDPAIPEAVFSALQAHPVYAKYMGW